MSEIHMTHFSFGGESPGRSRFHEIALHEARIATDHSEAIPATSSRSSIVERLGLGSRLRIAIAGGPAVTKPCNCPA